MCVSVSVDMCVYIPPSYEAICGRRCAKGHGNAIGDQLPLGLFNIEMMWLVRALGCVRLSVDLFACVRV